MLRIGWKRCTAGLAVTLLLVACSTESDDGSAGEVDELADITVEDDEPEPEPDPDPEPDADEPEPEPEPDPEPAEDPEGYDGFPIDEPVEDISVIDEAYVNEVLRVLDENYVEVVRAVQRLGVDNIDDVAYAEHILLPLAFTYSESLEQAAYQRTVAFQEREGFQAQPEPLTTSVTELLTVSGDCVSAEVRRDADPLFAAPFTGTWYVALTPRPALVDEAGSLWRYDLEEPGSGEVMDGCS